MIIRFARVVFLVQTTLIDLQMEPQIKIYLRKNTKKKSLIFIHSDHPISQPPLTLSLSPSNTKINDE